MFLILLLKSAVEVNRPQSVLCKKKQQKLSTSVKPDCSEPMPSNEFPYWLFISPNHCWLPVGTPYTLKGSSRSCVHCFPCQINHFWLYLAFAACCSYKQQQ